MARKNAANPLDRNVSIRLPVALLHRLENQVQRANESRTVARDAARDQWKDGPPPLTLSDAIRKACETWADIRENGGESSVVRHLLLNEFADKLTAMVAMGVHDADARALLEQIAAHQTKPEKESFPWD